MAPLQQAISLHQSGNLRSAEQIYRRILAADPDHADANHLLGLIAHQTGKNEDAMALVARAIKANPNQALYHCNLGIICMALQRWHEASSAFRRTLQMNPGDVRAHINLGIAQEAMGHVEEAITSYEKALSINPNDAETLNKLGNAYSQIRRWQEAEAAFHKALQINPVSAAALNNLGTVLREQRKPDESIATYLQALTIAPDRVEILCNLAMVLLDTGRLHEAEEACRKALSINPAFAEAYKQLSDALHFQQRTSDWDAMLDEALARGALSEAGRNYMFISKAIIAWMRQDVDACEAYLQSAQSILHRPVNDKVDFSAVGYHKFLSTLVGFRRDHPQYNTNTADQHIHIIGDSHSLSYTGTVITLHGTEYEVISHLIMGCKAWHLANPGMNQFKASFDLTIGQLPRGAKAMMSIGEIDCRLDEGIFPAHKKHGTKLDASIASLTSDYVQYVLDKAEEKRLEILFYGVPAPSTSLSHLPAADRHTYLQVVQLFNQCLSRAAASAHCTFIDVFRHTATEHGVSNGRYHIDPFHLSPLFLAHACRDLTTSASA